MNDGESSSPRRAPSLIHHEADAPLKEPRGAASQSNVPSAPAVELCGVSKRFGSRQILDRVDLRVAQGEILVLVGASGSGKSTLLKLISGIETPDEGRVWLAGQDCTDWPPYRRAVHTVFQNYALFPHLDVVGNVGFPLAVAGVPRAERLALVSTALSWVKLQQHAQRRVDTLSGGERQRVALARALVDSPQCVLLDEPLSALDPNLRAETLELLRSIQSRLGTTFIFITHDREEALHLGHRIGVLNRGRLEQVGTPEEVYRRPQTAYVAGFLGKINWLRGQLVGTGTSAAVAINGWSLPWPADGRNRPQQPAIEAPTNGAAAPQTGACGQPWVPVSSPGKTAFGTVKVGVRPEDLRISDDGGLLAQVQSRQFLGDKVVLRLTLEDGTMLVAEQPVPACAAAPGTCVRLTWAPEATHVFPDGEEVS